MRRVVPAAVAAVLSKPACQYAGFSELGGFGLAIGLPDRFAPADNGGMQPIDDWHRRRAATPQTP
jgi:hypothetical protein